MGYYSSSHWAPLSLNSYHINYKKFDDVRQLAGGPKPKIIVMLKFDMFE